MYQQDIQNPAQPNNTRLLLMGVASLLLCLSFIMSIFTPFPLAMSVILFGRSKGYAMISGAWLLAVFLSLSVFKDPTLFMFYSVAGLFAVFIAEIILRKKEPVKGMIVTGLSVVAILAGAVGVYTQTTDKTIKQQLVIQFEKSKEIFEAQKEKIKAQDSGSEESFQAIAMLSQPELLAEETIKQAPAYFFIGIFLMLWVNLFLSLKMTRMMSPTGTVVHTEKDLIHFTVPDHFIWLVIVGLVLAIWGADLGNEWYPVIGMTLIKCLGIFYFFQGFGIYLNFLDYIRLGGFFRTLLVVFTVFTASQMIALVGLFDMFVNFRRYFKKTN
jgi:hypothetical protein